MCLIKSSCLLFPELQFSHLQLIILNKAFFCLKSQAQSGWLFLFFVGCEKNSFQTHIDFFFNVTISEKQYSCVLTIWIRVYFLQKKKCILLLVYFSSDCCLYNQTLIQPDKVITTEEGIVAKCCHGVLMVKQEDMAVEVNLQQSSMEADAVFRGPSWNIRKPDNGRSE